MSAPPGPTCSRARPARRASIGVMVGVIYLSLFVWVTWPLAAHWSTHLMSIDPAFSKPTAALGAADHYLNLWILAWGCHAVATAPLSFFDANIFHPLPEALATGEHMLGVLGWFAPVYATTGNPIAGANALVFVSFVLAGLGTYWLVIDLTGQRGPAFTAGLAFAFGAWRFYWLTHLQLVGVHLFPFILLWLRRALTEPTRLGVFVFGAVLTLQALTSYYLGFMCVVLSAGIVFYFPGFDRGAAATRGRWIGVVAAGLGAALAVSLFSLPYLRQASTGVVPSGAEAQSAAWLAVASALPSEFLNSRSPLYLGWVASALALVGLWPTAGVVRVQLHLLWIAVAGWVLSLGPSWWGHTLPYSWLSDWLPGFSTLRVPERFVVLQSLGMAGLAGLGTARLRGLVASHRNAFARSIPVAVAVAALWLDGHGVRYQHVPRAFPDLESAPAAHRWLASHGDGGALLVLPMTRGFQGAERDARAQYFSILHWLPLLNGHSGYRPPFIDLYVELAERLPSAEALQSLVNIVDVRWILLHGGALSEKARGRWETPPPGLRLEERFGDDWLFRVERPPDPDWRAHLRKAGPETTTFAGLPIESVSPNGRRARIDASAPAAVKQGRRRLRVAVTVENPTPEPWPCYAASREGPVRLWARWSAPSNVPVPRTAGARIPRDLHPGESVSFSLDVKAPTEPGRYTLHVTVGQHTPGRPDFWRSSGRDLPVEVTSR